MGKLSGKAIRIPVEEVAAQFAEVERQCRLRKARAAAPAPNWTAPATDEVRSSEHSGSLECRENRDRNEGVLSVRFVLVRARVDGTAPRARRTEIARAWLEFMMDLYRTLVCVWRAWYFWSFVTSNARAFTKRSRDPPLTFAAEVFRIKITSRHGGKSASEQLSSWSCAVLCWALLAVAVGALVAVLVAVHGAAIWEFICAFFSAGAALLDGGFYGHAASTAAHVYIVMPARFRGTQCGGRVCHITVVCLIVSLWAVVAVHVSQGVFVSGYGKQCEVAAVVAVAALVAVVVLAAEKSAVSKTVPEGWVLLRVIFSVNTEHTATGVVKRAGYSVAQITAAMAQVAAAGMQYAEEAAAVFESTSWEDNHVIFSTVVALLASGIGDAVGDSAGAVRVA